MKAARDRLQHEGDVMRLVRTREEDCQAGFVLVADQFLADAEAKDRLEQVTIGDNLGAAQQEMVKPDHPHAPDIRSEEHTSELQSLMRISYAVFCLKKNKITNTKIQNNNT